jgi:hypothetical protein
LQVGGQPLPVRGDALTLVTETGAESLARVRRNPGKRSITHRHGLVSSVAKTVADWYKYRNKIGFDIALESLRDARGGRRKA